MWSERRYSHGAIRKAMKRSIVIARLQGDFKRMTSDEAQNGQNRQCLDRPEAGQGVTFCKASAPRFLKIFFHKNAKQSTAGIRWWSPTQLLTCRHMA